MGEIERGCELIGFVETEEAPKKKKKKDRAKKSKGKKEAENEVNFSQQLENKLKWAVDEVRRPSIENLSLHLFLVNKISKCQSYQ